MNIDSQAIRQIRETYLVSNTPLYLYKRLRDLPAVQRLAEDNDVEELGSEYLRRAKTIPRKPDDVALAYACLVALTTKEWRRVMPLIRLLDLSDLDWASLLRDIYLARLSPEESISIKAPAKLPRVRVVKDASNTSGQTQAPRPIIRGRSNI